MFKKLKQKISEEQQQQASSTSSTPTRSRSRTSSFSDQPDEVTPNRENASHATKSPDGVDRSETSTPQSGDTQTFAQKLQLRVPSMESLFRSPIKESLFRSSKESLVRTSSRESLNQLDLDSSTTFDPPSDMESEAEDTLGNSDSLSREQVLQRLRRMERSLSSYRGKYSEIVTAYQTLQREKKKLQGILSQSQDKALRRISELREELQMDQQAKKHLQEEFDASLEEKDQIISVLQTQVSLLKQRLRNGPVTVDVPTPLPPVGPHAEVGKQEEITEDISEPVGGDTSAKTLEMLQQRVRRQENLLQRSKESLQSREEQCTVLANEKEALQAQLDERLQELEKMKELHMAEKTKLITQLRDAKNLIEQLEQDKGMVITETKRQVHETLELKEEEIAQLRNLIRQMTAQGEELREQKEKSERAAFEELEKALSAAQKSEEAQRTMKAEMDAQIKAIEKSSEEERVRLLHELSRVKQEVTDLMKKSSEEQVVKLQKLHEKELASREQELTRKLQDQERELKDQMKIALEKSRSEYLKLTLEKEQQESLALEELELQKKAILTESENKLLELRQEAETYRTRILELETSLEKSLEESKTQSEHLAVHLEAEKNKHNKEITIMVEKHKTELESLQHQQDHLWTEKLQLLKQQHQTDLENLQDKYEREKETLLKDKEVLFQAHIQDMNERTLEKLDVKQTELESLSSELSEVLQARDRLVEELSALRDQADKTKQELEAKLDEQKSQHQQEVDSIMKEHELSIQRAETTLKDQISQLGLDLQEKEQNLLECQARLEQTRALEERLAQLQQTVLDLEAESSRLSTQVAELEVEKKGVCLQLDTQRAQVQQLERQKEELERRVEAQLQDRNTEQEQARQLLLEKENMILQMRNGQSQEIKILKQELSSKEDSISVLQEEYESKLKNQEKKIEKIKQKAKEMQETKKKLLDQEAKLKKELENTMLELSQKEEQFNAKVLEMAQADSAVLRLEASQKEHLASLASGHQRELSDVAARWERRLHQQAEELQEQHRLQLREREREVSELQQQLLLRGGEQEAMRQQIAGLQEEGLQRAATLDELHKQLRQQSDHLASVVDSEATLRARVQELEAESAALQAEHTELRALAEREHLQVSQLTAKLQSTEEECQSLRSSHERSEKSEEDRRLELQTLLEELAVQKAGAWLDAKAEELVSVSSSRTSALVSRIAHCQHQAHRVREVLLLRLGRFSQLEAQLSGLQSSLHQATLQLEDKETQIRSLKADIEGLAAEKEALQKEGGHQQQAASEKESCITQLKKELSENINAVTLLREELAEKTREIAGLRSRLESSESRTATADTLREEQGALAAKDQHVGLLEENLAQQSKRFECLQGDVEDAKSPMDRTEPSMEVESMLEDLGHQQAQQQDRRLQEAEGQVSRLEEQVASLQAELQQASCRAESQEEAMKALSERLERESAAKLAELKRRAEQKVAAIRRQLLAQMEEREQRYRAGTQIQLNELSAKLQEREQQVHVLEQRLQTLERTPVPESSSPVSGFAGTGMTGAEQEGDLPGQLVTEGSINTLQSSPPGEENGLREPERGGGEAVSPPELQCQCRELLAKLERAEAKQREDRDLIDHLQEELEEKKTFSLAVSPQVQEGDQNNTETKKNWENVVDGVQKTLREKELTCQTLEQKIKELESELAREKEVHRTEMEELASKYGKLQTSQQEMDRKNKPSEVWEISPEEKSNSHDIPPKLLSQGQGQPGDLEQKLAGAEREKQKLSKEVVRLQKDLRMLRKEHQQELDLLKQECEQEMEEKIKQEQEDLELKHNSTLKQLMREFNTQLAQKEQELERTIKETIDKAQEVEAELLESHQEETNQLHKKIAEKEDDLKRTARRYEEILDAREEEMTARVNDLQTQLEELQEKYEQKLQQEEKANSENVTIIELQTQLAQKTTLISDSKLKEQEFREQIHNLEDRLKKYEKNVYATAVGTPYKGGNLYHTDVSLLGEPTEFEYLRKVLFEYMMGRETKTMAKVITTVLKFPDDQTQKILEREDARLVFPSPRSGIF